jgi:hypothetical protein
MYKTFIVQRESFYEAGAKGRPGNALQLPLLASCPLALAWVCGSLEPFQYLPESLIMTDILNCHLCYHNWQNI